MTAAQIVPAANDLPGFASLDPVACPPAAYASFVHISRFEYLVHGVMTSVPGLPTLSAGSADCPRYSVAN
jgi:hypothetical protein